jgi:large subunit ribosomal protein L13
MKITKPTTEKDITRNWHLIDVKNEILGRSSTKIAQLLMGKSKPYFAKNMDCGDYVVVINSEAVRVTGKKEKDKTYDSYSGFPGGRKVLRLEEVRARKPEMIIKTAVSGMLPKNRLRARMLERLYIYKGETHPYENKFKGE